MDFLKIEIFWLCPSTPPASPAPTRRAQRNDPHRPRMSPANQDDPVRSSDGPGGGGTGVLNKAKTEITMTMPSNAASTSAKKTKQMRAVVFHPARRCISSARCDIRHAPRGFLHGATGIQHRCPTSTRAPSPRRRYEPVQVVRPTQCHCDPFHAQRNAFTRP